jgi:hypothetical protein
MTKEDLRKKYWINRIFKETYLIDFPEEKKREFGFREKQQIVMEILKSCGLR